MFTPALMRAISRILLLTVFAASLPAQANMGEPGTRVSTETYTYDALGNKISRTDFLGHKTSYTYDSNGRIAFATYSTGHTTGYLRANISP